MNSSYETINEITTVVVLASHISRLSSQVATTGEVAGQLSKVGIVSDLYGPQTNNDVDMVSPSNQTTQSVHIATLAVCNVLIGIVVLMGCVGNGAVIVQVITNWNARFGFAPLILNLAVSDFLICSCLSPVFLIFLFRSPPTPNIFCGLFTFMGTVCTLSSLFTMTAIALHRYRLMASSAGQRYLSIPVSLLTLAFIWAVGFSVALAGILYVSSNWNDPFQKCEIINLSNDERGEISDFAISFLAPVCALAFICTAASCLVMVLVYRLPTCWKNTCEVYNAEDRNPKMTEVVSIGFKQLIGRFAMVDKETRILYMVAILVTSFCWTPILIAEVLVLTLGESLVLYQLELCGIALVFLNSALHPYIYTEHGWRLKHRYRVCLHAAFDCRRTSPADQWSLGGGVAANVATIENQPIASMDTAETNSVDDTAIRTMTTMSVKGSVVKTRVCDCNRNILCNKGHGDPTSRVNINNVGNENEVDAAGEIEDNDTLDSGIDRDALSEVEDIYNDVDGPGDRRCPLNHQQIRFVAQQTDRSELPNYDGSLDSLSLTEGSSESSLYCADAAENLTVVLPPRNSTPTVTGAVGSRGKSGGAIVGRHSPLSSWSAAPLHHHPQTAPTSPSQQRQLYHYHHLHHHHHVILYPNNGDCVGAVDASTLHSQSCHAAGRRECELLKKEKEMEEEKEDKQQPQPQQQQQQEEEKEKKESNQEENKEIRRFCIHRGCDEAFRQEVAAASASGNKAAEVLLRLLSIEEKNASSSSSSSSSAPGIPSSSSSSSPLQQSSTPHRGATHSPPPCTCQSHLASSFSVIDPEEEEEEEDCPAQTPLISHCPLHCEHSLELLRRHHHPHHKIKGSEYCYPGHDDGVFVTEHSYPVLHSSQAYYHQEHFNFYPSQLPYKKTYPYSHHKTPHEQVQTDVPPRHKTHKHSRHRPDR